MTELTYAEAMDIIGGLGTPSKMPWFSWSISAFKCITGSKLREVEGSTCASCYACKGQYRFQNVKDAHERRLIGLDNPRFVEAFILVLTKLYERSRKTKTDGSKENRFRWHDSGDLQNVEHLVKINQIALATPFLLHWLPTREYGIVHQFNRDNRLADNLTLRTSAVMVGEMPKKAPMKLPFSTVGVDNPKMTQCPASKQGNKCLDCANCWDKSKDVNYELH